MNKTTEWTCQGCGQTLEHEVTPTNRFGFLKRIEWHHASCNPVGAECSFCGSVTNNPHFSIDTETNNVRVNQLCDVCYTTMPSGIISGYYDVSITRLSQIMSAQTNMILAAMKATDES